MPDPDDDVELPPSYDFTGGFGSFGPAPRTTGPSDPADPADPATPDPTDPAGSAAASASPSTATSGDPVMQPGGRPVLPSGSPPVPPVPPTRSRGWRGPTGPPVYGTPPTSGPLSSGSPTGPAPQRKPRKQKKQRTSGTSRPSSRASRTPPAPTTPATPLTTKRTRWTPWRMAGTAAAVVTVAIAIASNVDGDGASSSRTTTVPVEPDTSSIAWSFDVDRESRLMREDISGSSDLATGLGSVIVVGDQLVGRFSADPYEENGLATVRAIDLADGTGRDLLTLERLRCAAVPGAFGAGSDLITCSGVDDGSPLVVTLNVATGEEVRRWRVAAPVELLTATPDGVVTLDAVDTANGRTSLRWYGTEGALRWTVPSTDLPDSVREELVQERDEGFELLYNATIVPVGDGAILSASQSVVSMDSTGVTATPYCWAGSVVGDVFTCENEETGAAEGRDTSGAVLWSDEDLSLGRSLSRRAPVALASDFVYEDEGDYRTDNSLLDARTGRVGPVLTELEDYPRVFGTATAPVALSEEDREDYEEATVATVVLLDPRALGVAWSVELASQQYASVVVTDDRVLVEVDRRRWTVLDLADGSVVGGMATEGDVVAVVDGGVITSGYEEMARVELP